ncbi:unnamed protein product, partial [Durusdinium trenchii]
QRKLVALRVLPPALRTGFRPGGCLQAWRLLAFLAAAGRAGLRFPPGSGTPRRRVEESGVADGGGASLGAACVADDLSASSAVGCLRREERHWRRFCSRWNADREGAAKSLFVWLLLGTAKPGASGSLTGKGGDAFERRGIGYASCEATCAASSSSDASAKVLEARPK